MAKVLAYGVFVKDEFVTTIFFPDGDDEYAVKMTAALKSSPRIVFDVDSDIPNTYRYSVYVEEDYVDKFYQRQTMSEFPMLEVVNNALQSDPKIVWIETDYDVNPSMKWSFENGQFSLIGEN